jgi:hypothetical protein
MPSVGGGVHPISIENTPSQQAQNVDCKDERIAILKSIKPIVDPKATLATTPDNDSQTIQFFVVPDLAVNAGHVSQDGQVIYLPLAATVGPEADEIVGAKLFAQAVDKLLSLKYGDVCSPLKVQPGGT